LTWRETTSLIFTALTPRVWRHRQLSPLWLAGPEVGPSSGASARGPAVAGRITQPQGFLLVELNHEVGADPRGPGPTRGQSFDLELQIPGACRGASRRWRARGIPQPRCRSPAGPAPADASGGATSCRATSWIGGGGPRLVGAAGPARWPHTPRLPQRSPVRESSVAASHRSPNEIIDHP